VKNSSNKLLDIIPLDGYDVEGKIETKDMDNLFALVILYVIRIGFSNTECGNPNMIGFNNRSGNMVYVSKEDASVVVSVFKALARCLRLEIEKEGQVEFVIREIKSKLKLK